MTGRAGGCASASSDDLALTRLPQILRDFRRDNPLVDFELTVDQSGLLHQRLESDRLDVFIGKRPSGEQRGQLVKRERLVWVGTPSTKLDLTAPLPLVVYPVPSISRTEMRRALNRARLPYRSACLCRGVNGLIGAVAAGIGISAMAASLVPPSSPPWARATGCPSSARSTWSCSPTREPTSARRSAP